VLPYHRVENSHDLFSVFLAINFEFKKGLEVARLDLFVAVAVLKKIYLKEDDRCLHKSGVSIVRMFDTLRSYLRERIDFGCSLDNADKLVCAS
jgi:hypothetical protein